MSLRFHAWIALVLAGCGGDPRALDLTVRFASEVVRERTTAVEVTLRKGTCEDRGATIYEAQLAPADDDAKPPPELEPGDYVLVAAARDEACQVVGEGCTAFEAPLDEEETVVLIAPIAEMTRACPLSECDEGICTGRDAEAPDAGDDGGSDGDVPDSDAPDAEDCTPLVEVCNEIDDDCDDRVDETTDLQSDFANCGECGRSCVIDHAAAECVFGNCHILFCDIGFQSCDGDDQNGCETDLTEPESCGSCTRVCDALTPICRYGQCRTTTCIGDETMCGEDCALTYQDPRHCMYCSQSCDSPMNADATCDGTGCGFSCRRGYEDCNSSPFDGCETALVVYAFDQDGDGYGDPRSSFQSCTPPTDYVANTLDCEPTDRDSYLGAAETCDGVDNDCDSRVDEGLGASTDRRTLSSAWGDAYGSPAIATTDTEVIVIYTVEDGSSSRLAIDRMPKDLSSTTHAELSPVSGRIGTLLAQTYHDEKVMIVYALGGELYYAKLGTGFVQYPPGVPQAFDLTTSGDGQTAYLFFQGTDGLHRVALDDGATDVLVTDSTSMYPPLAFAALGLPTAGAFAIFEGYQPIDELFYVRLRIVYETSNLATVSDFLDVGHVIERDALEHLFLVPTTYGMAAIVAASEDGERHPYGAFFRMSGLSARHAATRQLGEGMTVDSAAATGAELAIGGGTSVLRLDRYGVPIEPTLTRGAGEGALAFSRELKAYYSATQSGGEIEVLRHGCR